MSAAMVAEIVRSFSELARLSRVWDRLATARPAPDAFHLFGWAQAWWEGYGASCEVFSPVVRDAGGEVVAIWPLVRKGDEIRALGDGASDHNDLLAAPGNAQPALRAALEALAGNGRIWKTGVITCVSERGLLAEAARGLAAASPVRLEIVHGGRGWAAVPGPDPDFFPRLARKQSLRRHRKKLERLGRVTFRHIEEPEEIEEHWERFQRQHIERWALKGVRSHFLDPASRAYYAALPGHLSPRGPLRFAVLEIDGRAVAYHLGFEAAGRYVWYKPAFDVDLSDCGPGEVLLQSVLQYCHSAGIRELDFTIGDEPYKERFSNVCYDYFQLHLFRDRSARQYALRARERLKRRPRLYRWLKSHWQAARDWLRRLRRAVERDGLAAFTARRLRESIGALLYRRDEVIVFRHLPREEIRRDPAAPEIELAPLRWSLLAGVAPASGGYLDSRRLRMFRKRLAAGDRGFVALHGGRVAHVAWVGKRKAIVAEAETGPRCVLPLSREASVIYDCWTPEEFRGLGIYPEVLRLLLAEEHRAGRDVWIYCLRENAASRSGIRKAGFTEAARLVRRVWFGRLEQCRVHRRGSGQDNL